VRAPSLNGSRRAPSVGGSKPRKRIGRALKPVVIAFAALYFLIDALFFALIKPFGIWLSQFRIFARVGSWVRSLGPYPTLALFVIPFVVLEPIKPVGFYLIASGRVIGGTLVIGVGEVLKITIVERLFQIGRDKLMTIPAFARCYEFVMSWRGYLETLAVWQAMLRWVQAIKERSHRMLAFARECLASLKRAR
ncbi:MAG: hypothetical protein ACXU8R_06495, partial [Xanthobacteraceae bacterium]